MPTPAHDSLFELPWVPSVHEHFPIVVRLEYECIALSQSLPNEVRRISQVHSHPDFESLVAEEEVDRLHSVMRHGVRHDLQIFKAYDIAGRKGLARRNAIER